MRLPGRRWTAYSRPSAGRRTHPSTPRLYYVAGPCRIIWRRKPPHARSPGVADHARQRLVRRSSSRARPPLRPDVRCGRDRSGRPAGARREAGGTRRAERPAGEPDAAERRRRGARAKIITGGTVAATGRNDPGAAGWLARCLRELDERDRDAVAGIAVERGVMAATGNRDRVASEDAAYPAPHCGDESARGERRLHACRDRGSAGRHRRGPVLAGLACPRGRNQVRPGRRDRARGLCRGAGFGTLKATVGAPHSGDHPKSEPEPRLGSRLINTDCRVGPCGRQSARPFFFRVWWHDETEFTAPSHAPWESVSPIPESKPSHWRRPTPLERGRRREQHAFRDDARCGAVACRRLRAVAPAGRMARLTVHTTCGLPAGERIPFGAASPPRRAAVVVPLAHPGDTPRYPVAHFGTGNTLTPSCTATRGDRLAVEVGAHHAVANVAGTGPGLGSGLRRRPAALQITFSPGLGFPGASLLDGPAPVAGLPSAA